MTPPVTRGLTEKKDLTDAVRVTWFGHSMFLLEDDRKRVLFDPFHSDMVGYSRPDVEADIVTVSHGHRDHNDVEIVGGDPAVFNQPGSYEKDHVAIKGIQAYHDQKRGAERGVNVIFQVEMKGISFEHLGDLGHVPEGGLAQELTGADVLFIPVGGIFTIDADVAAEVVGRLRPRIAIPMHYGTPDGNIPLGTEGPFIKHFQNVEIIDEGPVYLNKEELPEPTLILVMSYIA